MCNDRQNDSICNFCGSEYIDQLSDDGKGFWCANCMAYNFFEKNDDHRKFYLVLESKSTSNPTKISSSQKFNKRLALARYPGSKVKLIDYIHSHLSHNKSTVLASPYAGGAGVEFALLQAGNIEKLLLNEIDFGIYSLYAMIKSDPQALIDRILGSRPTHDDFFVAREIVKQKYQGCNSLEAAWSFLLVNRLAYSGIYNANPLGGREGNLLTLLSRFKPLELIKRINIIHTLSEYYEISQMDACEFIEENYWNSTTTMLVDPPYYGAGKKLYLHYYTEEDHLKLKILLESLYIEFPAADIILFYDDCEFIEELYFYPNVKKIGRVYTV